MKRLTRILTALLLLASSGLAGEGALSPRLTVPPSDIIFSHAVHKDAECLTCHETVSTSDSAQDKNLPAMDVCGNCHDIASDSGCGMCHRNAAEPSGLPNPERPILFSHKAHLGRSVPCQRCHGDVAAMVKTPEAAMPKMALCLECHDGATAGSSCNLCHGTQISLVDIHPTGWRHQHSQRAAVDRQWCSQCHRQETSCLGCHRGDNLTGKIHDLNYDFTHGLDAKGKEADCIRCHDQKLFCSACHEKEGRMPLRHSSVSWMQDHAQAARRDIENCVACHDAADPTCGRVGCHSDFDGIRGTDAAIHALNPAQFNAHGPWHSDAGYFCFQCHVNTGQAGTGFCGYCHSQKNGRGGG